MVERCSNTMKKRQKTSVYQKATRAQQKKRKKKEKKQMFTIFLNYTAYSLNFTKVFRIFVSNRFLALIPRSMYRASLISGKISAPSSNLLSSSYPTTTLEVLPILLSVHFATIVGLSKSVPISLPSFLVIWKSNLWPSPRKLRSLNES
jgi:hypothetical protein